MGSKQIDYILVSKSILPAVQRSGVLSHHSLLRGDHRPYYLDFDASVLFSDPAYHIEPAITRKLRLQDPRTVKLYTSKLQELLTNHNVFQRLDDLQTKVDTSQWNTDCQEEYESLDNVITESMLTAENSISKRITTTYQWSPALKQAVQQTRYWRMRLRQVRHQPVSATYLQRLQQEGHITPESALCETEQEIKHKQHQAYTHLKDLQARHTELRESFLEGLAEAIVLHRNPRLEDEGMEAVKKSKAEQQLKQLMSREKLRKMYRKISRILNKTKGKGLSSIDVPDARAASDTTGDPTNPNTWKGPWKSVTNPTEIAKVVCQVNAEQYHQAHGTPFGSGPLADAVGRRGDTPASVDLLCGKIPALPSSTLPETIRILQSLANYSPAVKGTAVITPAEFVSAYSNMSEQTSSSPSGRHIGHYKAVLDNPLLVQLHSRMMSIPFHNSTSVRARRAVNSEFTASTPNTINLNN